MQAGPFTTGFSPRCCLLHSRDCTMVHLLRKIRLFTFRRKGKDKRNDRSSQKVKASHYTSVDSSSMSTTPRNIPKIPSGGLMQIHQRRKKKHSSIDFDSLPIIDRVPTAIGYQSSCSEEGTDDGTPLSSRYRMWEHEEEVFKQNPSDDYDYISATDDRYSIFEGLDSLSSVSSTSDSDSGSVSSIESKIGHELQRQRTAFRDNIIRLTRSADLSGTGEEARGTLAHLDHCFSLEQHK